MCGAGGGRRKFKAESEDVEFGSRMNWCARWGSGLNPAKTLVNRLTYFTSIRIESSAALVSVELKRIKQIQGLHWQLSRMQRAVVRYTPLVAVSALPISAHVGMGAKGRKKGETEVVFRMRHRLW